MYVYEFILDNGLNYYTLMTILQEKQATYSRTRQPRSWLKGSSFSYSIRSVTFGSMSSLLMETALVILAQSTIYCCEISINYCHSCDVWNYVLGPWRQIVSQISVT